MLQSSACSYQDVLPNATVQDVANDWSVLHEAAASGNDKKLQSLLDKLTLDVTSKEFKLGNTPLHEAAWRGYSRCLKILCTLQLKKSKSDNRAVSIGNLLNIKNDNGFTALHLSAQNGHNQSCRELLLAGADHDIQNNYGDTPLHTACRYGHAGATRILISASCDLNKKNLNGDTPLHISCAMGRRKLTRILLKAGAKKFIKNAQNETSYDIAVRKNYKEIIEILNNTSSVFKKREKSKHKKREDVPTTDSIAMVNWSPYGCHYFPDPRAFPSPKLETLPKEPLKKGEQYYLDLAGQIHKGPIGVTAACYCEPFFRHIENKLNSDRKSIRKYVYRAKESLGNKVQALAIQTNKQIEQLTRSIIADRVRCENRRLQLDECFKRGQMARLSVDYPENRRQNEICDATLNRCRSLELLDNSSFHDMKLMNSKSCEILKDTEIVIHRNVDDESENEEGESHNDSASVSSKYSYTRSYILENRLDSLHNTNINYFTISERLGDLLAKTSSILDDENQTTSNVVSAPSNTKEIEEVDALAEINTSNDNSKSLTDSPIVAEFSTAQREQKTNKTTDKNSQSLNVCNASTETIDHHIIENVMRLLRNDPQSIKTHLEKHLHNEYERSNRDKLQYKINNSSIGEKLFESNENVVRHELEPPKQQFGSEEHSIGAPLSEKDLLESFPKSDFLKLSQPLQVSWKSQNAQKSSNNPTELEQSIGINYEKVEIKNSEIKSLKKSNEIEKNKRSKVHELVAKIQGKLSENQKLKNIRQFENEAEQKRTDSENKELEQNNNNEHKSLEKYSPQYPLSTQPEHIKKMIASPMILDGNMNTKKVQRVSQSSNTKLDYLSYPKDAYFHDIPKNRRFHRQHELHPIGLENNMPLSPTQHLARPVYLNTYYLNDNQELLAVPNVSRDNYSRMFEKDTLISPTSNNLKTSDLASDYEIVTMNCFKNLQAQSVHSQAAKFSMESHLFERDFSNDSGFSVRTIECSQRPSPNLSESIECRVRETHGLVCDHHPNQLYTMGNRIDDGIQFDELHINNLSSLV